jgi:hypothetical protein
MNSLVKIKLLKVADVLEETEVEELYYKAMEDLNFATEEYENSKSKLLKAKRAYEKAKEAYLKIKNF